MEDKRKRNLLAHVKECTDRIYETVIAQPGGYCGGFSQLGSFYSRVLKDLVDRNILKKERNEAAPRLAFRYTWIASMAPTKTLYENIAFKLRMEQKEYSEKNKQKKELTHVKIPKVNASEILTGPALENNILMEPTPNPLRSFTDAELWDELKARGYEIAEGRLAKFLN